MTVAVFLGDSTTDTATPHGNTTSARLGWTPSVQAFGGIGYLQSRPNGDGRFGGGTLPYGPFSDPQILALVDAAAPDIIVCEGGIDDGAYASADVGVAAGALYDYLHAHHPAARIYVTSAWTLGTRALSYVAGHTAAIRAAAAARGLTFIDMTSWLTGSGYTGHLVGDGNCDVNIIADGTHPTPAGSGYIGTRLAFAIKAPSTGLDY